MENLPKFIQPAASKNPQDEASLLRWKRPNVYGDFPEPRSGATITMMGNSAYVFGGLTKGFPPGPTNDLYALKIGQTSFEWKKPKLLNDDPAHQNPPKPKPVARKVWKPPFGWKPPAVDYSKAPAAAAAPRAFPYVRSWYDLGMRL